MSTTIDQAFAKQFEGEAKAAYQRMGSMLRGTVRTKNGVKGQSTHFPTVGKGTSGTKTRHGLVPVMNLEWDQVECSLVDQYAGEYVDDLDELKTNVDSRMHSANAAARALGRYTDEQIIEAMTGASGSSGITLTSAATIENSVLEAFEALFGADVPADLGIYAAVSWRTWSALMKVPSFKSADYRGPSMMPFMEGGRALQSKTWMGAHWITHSGLPKAGNTRTNFIYHSEAIGHAIQQDLKTTVSWENTRSAYFINSRQSMGACLIDDDGVRKLTIDESTALPTT